MRTIYLDQTHWIELATAYHGRDTDPALRAVLDFVVTSRETGHARFPLSMAHYVETAKRYDQDSRVRLATVMRDLSFGEWRGWERATGRHGTRPPIVTDLTPARGA